jgi:hypothetical protein
MHATKSTMPQYVDPETGLRRYIKVGMGAVEELHPAMTRYTKVHHTMNTLWETMEHVGVLQTSHTLACAPIRASLVDGMLSGGVAKILSTLLDERAKQNAEVLDDSVEIDKKIDTVQGEESTQPFQETRTRKSNLHMAKIKLWRVFPDYKTVCAGINLSAGISKKTLAHHESNSRNTHSTVCKPPCVPRYNSQQHGGRAGYRNTQVTPRGIYDKTSRFELHH